MTICPTNALEVLIGAGKIRAEKYVKDLISDP
jgi:hypothetical protein